MHWRVGLALIVLVAKNTPYVEVSIERSREYLPPYGPDGTCCLCSCEAQLILKHKRISKGVQRTAENGIVCPDVKKI